MRYFNIIPKESYANKGKLIIASYINAIANLKDADFYTLKHYSKKGAPFLM